MGKAQARAVRKRGEVSTERDDQLKEGLLELVSTFAERNRIPGEKLALMLVELGLDKVVTSYLFNTRRRSNAALARHIDRFQRAADAMFSDAKESTASLMMMFQLAEFMAGMIPAEAEETLTLVSQPNASGR
jgi:hypothetical protein